MSIGNRRMGHIAPPPRSMSSIMDVAPLLPKCFNVELNDQVGFKNGGRPVGMSGPYPRAGGLGLPGLSNDPIKRLWIQVATQSSQIAPGRGSTAVRELIRDT